MFGVLCFSFFFFFKQKTAYEMRISDWSSDVCSSDLAACASGGAALRQGVLAIRSGECDVVMVLGAEKMPRGFMDPRMIYADWQIEMGLSLNPSYWSMRAIRKMQEYCTTHLQIAKITYKNPPKNRPKPNAKYTH